MNTDLMFSSKTDDWATPQDFFDKLEERFEGFDLDPCADENNHKCEKYFTKDDDGLSQEWFGKVFVNPPYGRCVKSWVEKCYNERERERVDLIVLLIPARTDTSYFHDYIYKQEGIEIEFIRGRLKFGDSKNAAPFPSMLVIFKNNNFEKELIDI